MTGPRKCDEYAEVSNKPGPNKPDSTVSYQILNRWTVLTLPVSWNSSAVHPAADLGLLQHCHFPPLHNNG